jgi:hypothetical protein
MLPNVRVRILCRRSFPWRKRKISMAKTQDFHGENARFTWRKRKISMAKTQVAGHMARILPIVQSSKRFRKFPDF